MPKPDAMPPKAGPKEKKDHAAQQIRHFTAKLLAAQAEIDAMILAGFVPDDPTMPPEDQARYDELVDAMVAWERHIDRLLEGHGRPTVPGGPAVR